MSCSIVASGNTLSCQTVNGIACSTAITLSPNAPWAGMASTSFGGYGLLAGTGVYVYGNSGGYAEMGIRIN